MRDDGFVDMAELQAALAKGGLDVDDHQIKRIVFMDAKQRFALQTADDGQSWIRANQGHSLSCVKLESVATRLPPPGDSGADESSAPFLHCFHGTTAAAWASIQVSGLSRMNRSAIQMAIGRPGESHVISGMRMNSECVIEVDMAGAMRAGIEFFLSTNQVILSKGPIPPQFLKLVPMGIPAATSSSPH